MTVLFIDIVSYLKIGHALFNTIVLVMFLIQAGMGLRIRRARLSGHQAAATQRHHRTFGRYVAALGIVGYLAGVSLVMLDVGHVFKYPLHFLAGSLIVLAISFQMVSGGKISAVAAAWRSRHYLMGRILLFLYGFQAFVGLGILL